MRDIRISGIYIHPSLPLLILVAVVMGWGTVLAAFVSALIIHECGHAACAKLAGVKILSIRLTPFGAAMQLENENILPPGKDILVSSGGPAASFIALLFFSAISWHAAWLAEGMALILKYNAYIFAFNLLPALPLDGGRILRAALAGKTGWARATSALAISGITLGAIVLALAVWGAINGAVNLSLFLVAGFLLAEASLERRRLPIRRGYAIMSVQDRLRGGIIPRKEWAAGGECSVRAAMDGISPGCANRIWINGRIPEKYIDDAALFDAYLRNPDARLDEII